jgi:predicted nucleic acid-binding protein
MRFHTWLENEYHRSGHSGLGGQTPLEAWLAGSRYIFRMDAAIDLDEAFCHQQYRTEADTVISSSLYLTEIPNVIWKYVRAGQLSESDGSVLLAELYQYVDEFTDCPENAVESLHEAVRLGHPVYDLFFLTLARRNNATLLTKDKRLSDLAKELGVPVAE